MKSLNMLTLFFGLAIAGVLGTIVSILVGIWFDAELGFKLFFSTLAITLIPLWIFWE